MERELVVELESGSKRPAVAEEPLRTSASLDWEGVLVEQHRLGEVDSKEIYCLNHVAFLQLDGVATVEWRGDFPRQSVQVQPGQVSFLPALLPFSAQTENAGEFLAVSLEPAFLACATAEYDTLKSPRLRPVQAEDDPLLRELLQSFKVELETGNKGGALYAQTLATMLAVHLVKRYSATPRSPRQDPGGLGREQLLRTTRYVQERFATPISLKELAALNDISLFHFSRQFKRSTGLTPYEYVTRVRVERARGLLLQHGPRLSEVALQTGFYDQSHFSRHFKRVVGMTPAAFVRRHRQRKIFL